MSQFDLFGQPPAPPPVTAAAVSEDLVALGKSLPSNVRMGTSSWTFPGWKGIVYDGKVTTKNLTQHGLAAYAQHPLFRTVGLDRTYYAPVAADVFAAYAAAVPGDFRFLVKAHDWLTFARFPNGPRYGDRRGQPNPHFLDAAYATEEVVGPTLAGLGGKLGVLLFQFSPTSVPKDMPPRMFARRLVDFLSALPASGTYAVELREERLLTRSYRDALDEAGAVHCMNAMRGMPRLGRQWACAQASPNKPLVVRWMLPPNQTYGEAKDRFAPFDRLAAPDRDTRNEVLKTIAHAAGRDVMVIVNNKAEGCSPLSVEALAHGLAEQGG